MMPKSCHHETGIVIPRDDEKRLTLESPPCYGNVTTSDGESHFPPSSRNKALCEYKIIRDDLHFSREKKWQRENSLIHRRKYRKADGWHARLILMTACLAVFCKTQAFTMPMQSIGRSQVIAPSKLSARSSTAMAPEEVITAVEPQTKSKKQRRSSRLAWDPTQSLVEGLIPDNFESYFDFIDGGFHGSSSDVSVNHIPSRPKGRPANVPGAMSRKTLMDISELGGMAPKSPDTVFINRDSILELASSPEITNTNLDSEPDSVAPVMKKKRGRGRPRKNPSQVDEISQTVPLAKENRRTKPEVAFSTSITTNRVNVAAVLNEVETTKRKRRIKDLPPSRTKKDRSAESETTGMMEKGEDASLQKYYRTELLSAHEEYELGMKIQFMMKAEEVHEGLHLKLIRPPSINEWASACGFILHDDAHVNSEDVSHIRPLNVGTYDQQDPTMFVGNGLANTNGPGRGKGRVKGPPATALENFYYDVESEFEDVNGKRVKKKTTPNLQPINRGIPQEFVNMMLEGKEAKQRMVQCNMRLVVSISKRYGHVGVNIADLIQEGSIGLSRAAEKFEPLRGFKFSTYASWWIQQAVFRAIAYHSRTIRLPVHVHNHLNRVRRVRQELQREKGHPPSNEEMAEELHMTVEKYNKMLRLSRRAISLDIAKYQNNPKDIGHESETSLGDTISASEVIKDENTPEQNVNRVLFRDDLKEMLKILGDDERAVINARYGLKDGLTQTVTTVAAKMGQTKSWVRSAECCALRKLRRPWYEKRLWEHQNSLSG